jgi:hypothetical protein
MMNVRKTNPALSHYRGADVSNSPESVELRFDHWLRVLRRLKSEPHFNVLAEQLFDVE